MFINRKIRRISQLERLNFARDAKTLLFEASQRGGNQQSSSLPFFRLDKRVVAYKARTRREMKFRLRCYMLVYQRLLPEWSKSKERTRYSRREKERKREIERPREIRILNIFLVHRYIIVYISCVRANRASIKVTRNLFFCRSETTQSGDRSWSICTWILYAAADNDHFPLLIFLRVGFYSDSSISPWSTHSNAYAGWHRKRAVTVKMYSFTA